MRRISFFSVHIAVTEEGPKSSEPTFDTMFDYYSKWGNQVCRIYPYIKVTGC